MALSYVDHWLIVWNVSHNMNIKYAQIDVYSKMRKNSGHLGNLEQMKKYMLLNTYHLGLKYSCFKMIHKAFS